MRRVVFLLLGVLLESTALAQGDVPTLTGRVIDNAELLGEPVEEALDAQLAEHERQTSNQVVVFTIPSLEGDNLEDYANRVFRTWGLGQADDNNGVLLLIAKDDRKIRIEVGYGLEGSLTDAAAGSIIRNEMTPRFRSGDFEGGTLAAVSAILGTIEGTYSPPRGGGGVSDGPPWWFFAIFLVTHGLLPAFIAFRSIVYPPGVRYFTLFVSLFFVGALAGIFAGFVVGFFPEHPLDGFLTAGVLILCYLLVYFLLDLYMSLSSKWQKVREEVRKASKSSKRTKIDAGWISFSAGGSSSSSSGGGFSSGGFSGGGGSSGGGGASGGW